MPITIRLKRNGPLTIAAEEADQVVLLDADGNRLIPEPGRIALCRCGGSNKKPFCDGTHKQNCFVGTSEPLAERTTDSTPDATGSSNSGTGS